MGIVRMQVWLVLCDNSEENNAIMCEKVVNSSKFVNKNFICSELNLTAYHNGIRAVFNRQFGVFYIKCLKLNLKMENITFHFHTLISILRVNFVWCLVYFWNIFPGKKVIKEFGLYFLWRKAQKWYKSDLFDNNNTVRQIDIFSIIIFSIN